MGIAISTAMKRLACLQGCPVLNAGQGKLAGQAEKAVNSRQNLWVSAYERVLAPCGTDP
jgi:hypothetical protein